MTNKVRKNILFNKIRDKDILEWLEEQENQAETVREALQLLMIQRGLISAEPTLTDVLDEVKGLSKQLADIKIVQGSKVEDHQEPPDLVAKLKDFGV